ncbi:MAG: NADH-quinone oxidoreductase subunit M, partial [Cocleimonas sp.]|nr:NADH-quinone oxidoreductase subunit M [Cocleimonas sp.]
MFDGYLLSVLVWLPIIGGIAVLFAPEKRVARPLALVVSVLTFIISIPLWTGFNPTGFAMQFVELSPWIATFNINYHLAVDGISMPLILLNTFTTVLIVIAGWEVIQKKPGHYMA